jgi:pimeloyl-ACP methyl ester carboxylesterase
MAEISHREVAGPAGRLHVAIADGPAEARPVLFLHGINMSHDVWVPLIEALPENRRYVSVDLRGHGASNHQGPFDAPDYAADALAVLDALEVPRAHVVGTSFGGSVACVLAARAPERVASVTAIGSALKVEGIDVEAAVAALQAVGLRGFFEGFMPQASFAPGTDPTIIGRAVDIAVTGRTEDTVIAVSRAAFTADVTAAAQAVTCPALVIVGEHDATCPQPLAEEMATALRARLVVLPGRGHVATYEDPTAVADILGAHLTAPAAQPVG